jgi:hypothetical protein
MPIAEGALIKSSTRPEIWLIEGGKRRWIPDAPTLVSRWTWEQVKVLSDDEVNAIPLGAPYPSVLGGREWPEGSLVKGSGPEIYVIRSGQRHWIPDESTFTASGFDWNKIQVISDPELNAIPVGPALPHAARLVVDLDTFLGAGHYMTTHASLLTSSGHIDARTRTRTITWFGGYHGAVVLLFADSNDDTIGQSSFHRYGVDGTVVGTSDRTDYWPEEIGSELAQRTTTITAFHSWAPDTLKDIVGKAVDTVRPVLDVYKDVQPIGGGKTSG